MAKKSKPNRFLKGFRAAEPVPSMRSGGRPVGLYLLELRSRLAGSHALKRKLMVTVDPSTGEDAQPQAVNIIHARV